MHAKRITTIVTLALLAFALPLPLFAQSASPWELNVHAGTLIPDEDLLGDDDAEFQLGARLYREVGSGFAVGGNVDWTPVSDAVLPGADANGAFTTDANVFLYSAEVRYTLPLQGPVDVFGLVGAGAGTVSYDDQPPTLDDDSSTSFLLPFGGGIRWTSASGRWGLRGEVRDNVLFVDTEDSAFLFGDDDTEDLHNVEITGGVSFYF